LLHPIMNTVLNQTLKFRKEAGDVGIELEIEGRRLPRDPQPSGWIVKEENSLRGECAEYVTKGSLELKSVQGRVKVLNLAFAKVGGEVIPSDRCSTHIHLNMQNKTFRTFFGTLLVFTICEPVLLRLCGEKRNGNLFCMPSYETGDLHTFMSNQARYLKNGSVYDWYTRGKYAAMCTDHVVTFGTLEARCFPLSVDPDQISTWATWLCRMRDVAEGWKTDDMSDLGRVPEEIAYEVFRGTNISLACRPENVSDLLLLGAETAYEAWRGLLPLWNYNDTPKTLKPRKKSILASYADGETIATMDDPDA
jgi:hypothetical protein